DARTNEFVCRIAAAAQRRFAFGARAFVVFLDAFLDAFLGPRFGGSLAAVFAGLAARFAHSSFEASRAPSARAASFAHTMLSCTSSEPAKVAKPQSDPAMTFSRPAIAA